MPALTIGIAQQQYSLAFMVVGDQVCEIRPVQPHLPLHRQSVQNGSHLSDAMSHGCDTPRSPSLHHGPFVPRRPPGPRVLRCHLCCPASFPGGRCC